ncbi:MAG: DUF3857 domain-containing protein [Weeksellaceae bacterium]
MRTFTTIFLLLSFTYSFSQVKFGKVTVEELSSNTSAIDESAVAEVISKEADYEVLYRKIEESFKVVKKIKVRVKVYDKDKTPDAYLNIKIPLYILKHDKEEASNIVAYTYNLVDGRVEKTKVEKSNIFKEEKNEYIMYKKFAFPNVQNGSIIEYKYTIETPRFFDLDTWYFQEEIPVRFSKFLVSYPEFFIYNKDIRGEFLKNIKTKKHANYRTHNVITDELTHTDVPALKNEPFVRNPDNLKTSIRYELKEYSNPGVAYKSFSTDWATVVKNLEMNDKYGGALSGNRFLDKDVAKFKDIKNAKEKIEQIFKFVKTQYTWNRENGLYPKNGIRKTFKSKTGNGTDLNFILISMLNKASIKAYPIVLSTVSNGMLGYIASRLKLNHTITGAYIGDQLFLMDPKDKFSQIGILPLNDMNSLGFMMLEKGAYKIINLENQLPSEIKTTLVYAIEDDMIKGTLSQIKTNHYALSDFRTRAENEEDFEKIILSDYDIDVLSFKTQENIPNSVVQYRTVFEDQKSLEEIGNKLFIQPLLFLKKESNAFNFRNAERKYPLEFGSPYTKFATIKIKIPDGFIVDYLPEDMKIKLSNNVGGYAINFKQDSDYITIEKLVHMGYSALPADYYVSIKDMYQKMIEKENEQIIFKKL